MNVTKKFFAALCLLAAAGLPVFAQNAADVPAGGSPDGAPEGGTWNVMTNGRYRIEFSCGPEAAALLAVELEQRFNVCDALLRFGGRAAVFAPLRVKVFADRAGYAAYAASALPPGDGERFLRPAEAGIPAAVFLRRRTPGEGELVLCADAAGPDNGALAFQAFIQFLTAFIPDPPSWMREGFAVYFSGYRFNREKRRLVYRENLDLLETAREASLPRPLPHRQDSTPLPDVQEILLSDSAGDAPARPQGFQARSWALASFLLSDGGAGVAAAAGDGYYRSLTDSFMLLREGAPAAENGRAVCGRILAFRDAEELQAGYAAYLASLKTFGDFMEEGGSALAAKNYGEANAAFAGAAKLDGESWHPPYCLGLAAYEAGDYGAASLRYAEALEHGAPVDLAEYALGLNAAASGDMENALRFLGRAAERKGEYGALAADFMRKLAPPSGTGR